MNTTQKNIEAIEDCISIDLCSFAIDIQESIDNHFGPYVPELQEKVSGQFDSFIEDFLAKMKSMTESAIEKSHKGQLIYTESDN